MEVKLSEKSVKIESEATWTAFWFIHSDGGRRPHLPKLGEVTFRMAAPLRLGYFRPRLDAGRQGRNEAKHPETNIWFSHLKSVARYKVNLLTGGGWELDQFESNINQVKLWRDVWSNNFDSITITHQGGRRRRFSSMVFSIGNVTLPRLQVTN